MKGDQDYKRECLELANVNSNTPCSHCPANTGEYPWFDFRRCSQWMHNCYTPDGFEKTKWFKSWILKLPMVNIDSIYPDWMHDKNLGSDKVIYACIPNSLP